MVIHKKFDLISDIHIDSYIRNFSNKNKLIKDLENWYAAVCNTTPSDILVIAGDIANTNYSIEQLILFLKNKYKHIITVLGNHEYYLDSKTQCNKYKHNSLNRINELKEIYSTHNVHLLENTKVLEIEGIRFLGDGCWYDVSEEKDIKQYNLYHEKSNDSSLIRGYLTTDHYKDCYERLVEKLKHSHGEVDVVVTHIPPKRELLLDDKYYGFYSFDNEVLTTLLDKTKPIAWCYGHEHGVSEISINNIRYIRNCAGYKTENLYTHIKTIEL